MRNTLIRVYSALSIALMLGVLAGLNIASAQSPVDYDADDDGLIEIEWLEQLNAVRWDLDGDGLVDDENNAEGYLAAFPGAEEEMGCADGCQGYELTRDLDFQSASSYASGVVNEKWTSGNGWLPIGYSYRPPFLSTFGGNEHTIANLYINRIDKNQPEVSGLFGVSEGHIRQVGVTDVDVSGRSFAGGLVGENQGRITSSYATGNVSGENVGGLIGASTNYGVIVSSHATSNVLGRADTGGLVGHNIGSITSSYATGNVSNDEHSAGGLVGVNSGNGSIISSYATGSVSGGGNAGGLVARNGGTITLSYATGSVFSDGGYGVEAGIGGLVGWNAESISFSYATGWSTTIILAAPVASPEYVTVIFSASN